MHRKIVEERNKATQEERMTRYADANYKYEPMAPVHFENPVPGKF